MEVLLPTIAPDFYLWTVFASPPHPSMLAPHLPPSMALTDGFEQRGTQKVEQHAPTAVLGKDGIVSIVVVVVVAAFLPLLRVAENNDAGRALHEVQELLRHHVAAAVAHEVKQKRPVPCHHPD